MCWDERSWRGRSSSKELAFRILDLVGVDSAKQICLVVWTRVEDRVFETERAVFL
jgi:hypothetical protein